MRFRGRAAIFRAAHLLTRWVTRRSPADPGVRPTKARWLFALLLVAQLGATDRFHYGVVGDDPGPWPAILSSVSLFPGEEESAGVLVLRGETGSTADEWRQRVEDGGFLVLDGASDIAAAFGFRKTEESVPVRSVVDDHDPEMEIVWEEQQELSRYTVPPEARVFVRERWTGAPLVAGMQQGKGAVLWLSVSPGEAGYERFPYLIPAFMDLGLEPPVRSNRLWAFFDSAYRARVDLDYFAERWRSAGISSLQVAAWHYFEPDPERDEYLRRLIEACHRHAILVYAWLELPHVSEAFWNDHPEWREKTALLQDAHLDWRKLMNLVNPESHRAVAGGVHQLIDRFDWDGMNLAELYFESLEGYQNPARFTPMNDDVRREFADANGLDPIELFRPESPHNYSTNPGDLRLFLDYRVELAKRIEGDWIRELESARSRKSHLDLVLTHVDDRLDTGMRDLIGADSAEVLPLLEDHDFTLLIEDPATVWNLGPNRYTEIASRYELIAPRPAKLAIDINIVERYQDVYPTKQQTGTELYQQLHAAGNAFPRVAIYAEHSIERVDLPVLPAAAAGVARIEQTSEGLVVESSFGTGVAWRGGALVDGAPWPFADDDTLWLPPGSHVVEPDSGRPGLRLLDFNGGLDTAFAGEGSLELSYRSNSRAFAVMENTPVDVEIDGVRVTPSTLLCCERQLLLLPRGQHLVVVRGTPPAP